MDTIARFLPDVFDFALNGTVVGDAGQPKSAATTYLRSSFVQFSKNNGSVMSGLSPTSLELTKKCNVKIK